MARSIRSTSPGAGCLWTSTASLSASNRPPGMGLRLEEERAHPPVTGSRQDLFEPVGGLVRVREVRIVFETGPSSRGEVGLDDLPSRLMDLFVVETVGATKDTFFQEIMVGVCFAVEGLLVFDGGHDQRSGLGVQVFLQLFADGMDVLHDLRLVGRFVGEVALAVKDDVRSGGGSRQRQGMALKPRLGFVELPEVVDALEHIGHGPLLDTGTRGLEEADPLLASPTAFLRRIGSSWVSFLPARCVGRYREMQVHCRRSANALRSSIWNSRIATPTA